MESIRVMSSPKSCSSTVSDSSYNPPSPEQPSQGPSFSFRGRQFCHGEHVDLSKRVVSCLSEEQVSPLNKARRHSPVSSDNESINSSKNPPSPDYRSESQYVDEDLLTSSEDESIDLPKKPPTPGSYLEPKYVYGDLLASSDNVSINSSNPPQPDYCSESQHVDKDLLASSEDESIGPPKKTFQCSVCNKGFSRKGDLVRHQRIHTGEKPYKCTTCGVAFAQKCNLTQHERTHTGEKPYQCSTCGSAFTQKGSLTKHQLIHTGEKPYKCNTCDRSFTQQNHLTRHQRRIHAAQQRTFSNLT